MRRAFWVTISSGRRLDRAASFNADERWSRIALGADATEKLPPRGGFFWMALDVSDRPVRFGMIAQDAAPTIAHLGGAPIIFHSSEETIEYAQLHDVQRWLVYGDPDGC